MKSKQFALLAAMSALLVGTSLLPAPASAESLQLGNGAVLVQWREYDPRYNERRYDPRYDDRRYDPRYDDRRYDRRPPPRMGCSPREALSAASRYLSSPRITAQDRNSYYIEGYGRSGGGRGRSDSVNISTAPGCRRV